KKEIGVSFEKEAGTFDILDYSPQKVVFGEGFPKAYPIELKINFSEEQTTELLKMITTVNDTINFEHHLIFRQGNNEAETKLQKETEEIKSDIALLKKQLVEGDTAKTFIGKIIIKKEASVYPQSAY